MAVYDEHVNSCKRHRMDIMDEYLASIGQQRKPISKDGSCLFRAVSEQLFFNQAQHLHVRELCLEYMERHRDIFEHFIDDPFNEYLARMANPKEWGDQIEISALSKLYQCDFYIYEQPGQLAKNVTDNDYTKRIYLCHSGQKHYDSVFSIEHFEAYGICQSIVSSILFKNILGMKRNDEEKLVQTFRMLSPPSSDCQLGKERNRRKVEFPLPSIYEPSIGSFSDGIPAENQQGLAYKLPVSLDFTRSLDPSVCRNIDYDFWITIKRKQQYIDFSIAEGLQYCIGDRCLVNLNIYSKPLIGHVQEVSPGNGPITVFIEALGGMHTIAVKNAQPLELFSCKGRDDFWPRRVRRFSSEGSWNSKSGGNRKIFGKNKPIAARHSDAVDFSPKCHLEFVASQQKKLRGNGKGSKGSPGEVDRSKRLNECSPCRTSSLSKLPSNSNHHKYRWIASRQQSVSSDFSPAATFRGLSINQDSFTEESWKSSSGECSESTVVIPPYPGPYSEWNNSYPFPADFHHQSQDGYQSFDDKGFSLDQQYWEQEEQALPCDRINAHQEGEGSSNNHNISQGVVSPCESNSTLYVEQNQHSTPRSPQEEEADYHQMYQQEEGHCQDQHHSSLNYDIPIYSSTPNETPHISGPAPSAAVPRNYIPYSATMTMVDCDGKEIAMVDDKNPFQYFYNLGLEYYRQLNFGTPRPIPVVFARPSSQFGAFPQQPPIVQPQPINFVQPGSSPHYPTPHLHPSGGCISMPHYHPTLAQPPGVATQGPFPPGRFLVHVPPAPPHHQSMQARTSTSDAKDIAGPFTTNHSSFNQDLSNETPASQGPSVTQMLSSPLAHPIQSYPVPACQRGPYLPQYYPQTSPPSYPPCVRMYGINRNQGYSPTHSQSRGQYTM